MTEKSLRILNETNFWKVIQSRTKDNTQASKERRHGLPCKLSVFERA